MSSPFRRLHKDPVSHVAVQSPAHSPLTGKTVTLEPIDPASQASSLFALTDSGQVGEAANRVWDFLPYGPFTDEAQLTEWQSGLVESTDPLFFAWKDHASGQHTGMGSFMRIDTNSRCIEIGHLWMAPVFQNTRASTECLFLMMRHAFDDLKYRRLEWKCDALNTPIAKRGNATWIYIRGYFFPCSDRKR